METMIRKLTSRKFWICVAAFLASVATSVTGLQSNNQIVASIGIICSIVSAAIYASAEAYVDAARKETNPEETKTDTKNSKDSKDKEV